MSSYVPTHEEFIKHHGIKFQKWGVRRYQNEDGSLTPEGRRRYRKLRIKDLKRITEEEIEGLTERIKKENALIDLSRKQVDYQKSMESIRSKRVEDVSKLAKAGKDIIQTIKDTSELIKKIPFPKKGKKK